MKNIFLCFLLLTITIAVSAEATLTGRWTDSVGNGKNFIQFESNKSVQLSFRGIYTNKKNSKIKKAVNITYKTMDDRKPKGLELMIRLKKDPDKIIMLEFIYEFIDDNHLRLYIDYEKPGEQPTSFKEKDEEGQQIFTKVIQ